MLISMTGFGSASTRENGFAISAEIKSVNNRFLKTSIRLPDGFASLEAPLDELLRAEIARGSVNLTIKIEESSDASSFGANFDALRGYLTAIARFREENPELSAGVSLGSFAEYLRLPGVAQDATRERDANLPELLRASIFSTVRAALTPFEQMRRTEGEATRVYLASIITELRAMNDGVKAFAPSVVENYRAKLTERVGKALAENGVELSPSDLVREVAIFADRADISEEIARFYSHLDQFEAAMRDEAACGKKLDFLTQEMFRETNTIGSKANSPELLKSVVAMKSAIERARELVQNVD